MALSKGLFSIENNSNRERNRNSFHRIKNIFLLLLVGLSVSSVVVPFDSYYIVLYGIRGELLFHYIVFVCDEFVFVKCYIILTFPSLLRIRLSFPFDLFSLCSRRRSIFIFLLSISIGDRRAERRAASRQFHYPFLCMIHVVHPYLSVSLFFYSSISHSYSCACACYHKIAWDIFEKNVFVSLFSFPTSCWYLSSTPPSPPSTATSHQSPVSPTMSNRRSRFVSSMHFSS